VGDDAVSRFVAHGPDRELSTFNGVAISYVGMGSPVVLGGKNCRNGLPGSAHVVVPWRFPRCPVTSLWAGSHLGQI
jgi:hypothetical protein